MTVNVDAAIEALARTQQGAFSRTQARQRGATDGLIDRRLTAGRWLPADTGVFLLPGHPRTFLQRLFVATLATPGSFVSHEAAARVHGLDAVRDAQVEVTAPRGSGRRSRASGGVVHHPRIAPEPEDVTILGSLPVASAARTLADLASRHPVPVLERVYESAARQGLIVPDDLDRIADRLGTRRVPGAGRLRALRSMIVRDDTVNGSDLETVWFQLVRKAGLPLPTRQRLVVRPDGRLAFADYAWPARNVIVELEGYEWHSSRLAHRADVERNNDLAIAGWTVVRFTWRQVVHDPDYVVGVLFALLGTTRAA